LRKVPTRSRQEAMGSSSVSAISRQLFFAHSFGVKTSRRRAFLSILHLPNLFSGEFWSGLGAAAVGARPPLIVRSPPRPARRDNFLNNTRLMWMIAVVPARPLMRLKEFDPPCRFRDKAL
jgi:hypothetical protein